MPLFDTSNSWIVYYPMCIYERASLRQKIVKGMLWNKTFRRRAGIKNVQLVLRQKDNADKSKHNAITWKQENFYSKYNI